MLKYNQRAEYFCNLPRCDAFCGLLHALLTLGTKLHQASQLLSRVQISGHNLIFKWEEGVGVLSGFGYAPTLMGKRHKILTTITQQLYYEKGKKKKAIMKLMSS